MLNIDKEQRVTVWEVKDKGSYTEVRMSSSRKDKRDDSYKNSNWSFVRFVGKAHEKAKAENLERQDRIVLKGAGVSLEDYIDADGNKQYPKNSQITVFNWERLEKSGDPTDAPPRVESSHEEESAEDIPF